MRLIPLLLLASAAGVANGQATYTGGYYGYVEVGKRWKLNDSGTWSYAPYATVRTDGHGSSLSVQPLPFTFSF